jgi:hypothetical protein
VGEFRIADFSADPYDDKAYDFKLAGFGEPNK